MDKYLFSAITNAFYPISLKEIYEDSNVDFSSSVSVSEDIFTTFTSEPPPGKVRIVGKDGYPEWGDIPPPTHEELVVIADAQKQSLIDEANKHINRKQWPGKAAIGRLKGEELVQYNLWLDYLDTLELVDTSGAPDIEWPLSPQ